MGASPSFMDGASSSSSGEDESPILTRLANQKSTKVRHHERQVSNPMVGFAVDMSEKSRRYQMHDDGFWHVLPAKSSGEVEVTLTATGAVIGPSGTSRHGRT